MTAAPAQVLVAVVGLTTMYQPGPFAPLLAWSCMPFACLSILVAHPHVSLLLRNALAGSKLQKAFRVLHVIAVYHVSPRNVPFASFLFWIFLWIKWSGLLCWKKALRALMLRMLDSPGEQPTVISSIICTQLCCRNAIIHSWESGQLSFYSQTWFFLYCSFLVP